MQSIVNVTWAAVVVVAFGSSCTERRSADLAKQQKITAPAPPSPAPGSIELTVTGAVEKRITSIGPSCSDGHVSAHAVSDPAAWSLTSSPARLFSTPADFRLSFGDVTFVWQEGATPGTVLFERNGLRVDASARRWKSTELIHVKGSVSCPDLRTAPKIDPRIIDLLRQTSVAPVRPYSTYEFGRAKDARALSIIVPEKRADALVHELRARLGPGWSAWRGTSRFVDERDDYGVEVVVGAMRSPADILRQAHVDPVNHGMSTEDVVAKISGWHQRLGVDILQADVESVDLRFEALPENVRAFAEELYDFCPDIVDQGFESVEALEAALRNEKRVTLWWD